ncbi:YibE/F family protein [bacterium]|nr:YibE/F family protein [bacterium]
MKKKITTLLVLLIGFFIPTFAYENNILPAERGLITNVKYYDVENISGGENVETKQEVKVKLLTGKFKGEEILLDNMLTGNPVYDIMLSKGDKVILHQEANVEFVEEINDVNFYISDIERVNALYIFTAIFFALLLIIGKRKGVLSFISILATIALIFFMLTPMLLHGVSPILATLLVCVLSTLVTIYLVAGFNHKSTSAVLGTVFSLGLAALLSVLSIKIATLTGFAGDDTMFLYTARPDLDFTGILSAAVILAALGAVMDVGVSIASTINEIYETDNTLGINELFKSGMNVGRDVIGTMSNTLILVYLGSSLPLVLLSNNIDLVKFFNLNLVATEILSALIGSIAILACVPITAIISAYLIKQKV